MDFWLAMDCYGFLVGFGLLWISGRLWVAMDFWSALGLWIQSSMPFISCLLSFLDWALLDLD